MQAEAKAAGVAAALVNETFATGWLDREAPACSPAPNTPTCTSSTHPRVYPRCSPTSRSPSPAPRRTTMIRPPNDHGESPDHVSSVRAQHPVLERSAARSFWWANIRAGLGRADLSAESSTRLARGSVDARGASSVDGRVLAAGGDRDDPSL
jgi:hypothetical protein